METIDITTASAARPVAKAKTTTILYWSLTVLFVAFMLLNGVTALMGEKNGQDAIRHLGYPLYILNILGVAKILGALALVQHRFRTLREWAYAGFTINFIGAGASCAVVMGIGAVIPAAIALAVMFTSYFLWKKLEQQSAQAAGSSLA